MKVVTVCFEKCSLEIKENVHLFDSNTARGTDLPINHWVNKHLVYT